MKLCKNWLIAQGLKSMLMTVSSVAGVLDEPYSQLSKLSGVAVQARQST